MTTPPSTGPARPTLSDAGRRFLDSPRFGIVSCLNPDGSPLQAVIWYRLDDGDALVFSSRIGRQWPTNIVRDRRVSVAVADGYNYVEMRGLAEVDEDPVRGQDVIADLARRYRQDPAMLEEQIAAFARQSRVTFTLRPTRIFERLSDK